MIIHHQPSLFARLFYYNIFSWIALAVVAFVFVLQLPLLKSWWLQQPVLFSKNQGFYDQPVTIHLRTPYDGTQIRFTIDGSQPTSDSRLYQAPLKITQTVALRAAVFQDQKQIGETVTKTFLIDEHTKLPVFSIVIEPDELWNPDTGIYVRGNNNNKSKRGKEWHRIAEMSFFDGRQLQLNQEVEMMIFGGASRSNPQKSLRICSPDNDEYIHYQFFPDYPRDHFDCFLLRAGGSDWFSTMIRDAALQSTVADTKLDIQQYRPTIVFINGQYWGIHNIREWLDVGYLSSKYGVSADDFTTIDLSHLLEDLGGPVLREGRQKDADQYLEMIEKIERHDMQVTNAFYEFKNKFDLDNLLIYMVSEMYFANHDWPLRNVRLWKYQKGEKEFANSVDGRDGRWRWMLYDVDSAFGLEEYIVNGVKEPAASQDSISRFDRAEFRYETLLENVDFAYQFINLMADSLNTRFQPENVIAHIDVAHAQLVDEIPRHAHRWRYGIDAAGHDVFSSLEEWQDNVEYLREFARQRPQYMWQQMVEYFGLRGTYDLSLDIEGKGSVRINTISIDNTHTSWHGTYFQDVPVELEAVPAVGYVFKEWKGDYSVDKSLIEMRSRSDKKVTAVFERNWPQYVQKAVMNMVESIDW